MGGFGAFFEVEAMLGLCSLGVSAILGFAF